MDGSCSAAPRAVVALAIVSLVLAAGFQPASAAPGDTTWVHTFDQEFINWATPHFGTFNFPSDPTNWQEIVLFLTIECPGPPGDCDPWDRLGNLRVVTPDQGDVEIARFITPYDITISGGPGSCEWTHGCTNYKSLLHGEVDFRLFVESWIGGNRGWLITMDFAFIEGELALEPYRVVNLWNDDWVEYGNPDDPVTNSIGPIPLDIPSIAEKVEVRMFTTGHGQGNTANCAEFCRQEHTLVAAGTVFSHDLWRSNCWLNTCSPQGGTWNLARAGWCPGARATPWKVDITDVVTPGQTITLDYQTEAYENLCRPGNASCVSGDTCADCNYNSTGHTPPIYVIQSQAIFFTTRDNMVGVDWRQPDVKRVELGQNAPNPFTPATTFHYTIPQASEVGIEIHDAAGRIVRDLSRHHATPGTFSVTWDGRDRFGHAVAAGVYFYTVRAGDATETRKMIRLR